MLKEYRERRSSDPILREQYDGRLFTINGQVRPTIKLRPGEWQLWRFGNSGPHHPFQSTIQGHSMVIVGRDGVTVLHPSTVSDLIVDPGSRYEVLVPVYRPAVIPFWLWTMTATVELAGISGAGVGAAGMKIPWLFPHIP